MSKLVRLLLKIGFIIIGVMSYAQAQTTQTYTGTIKDLSGAVVTSGQVTFTLAPPSDSTIPGVGRFVATTIPCNINADGTLSGFISGAVSGACTVTANISLSPTGTSYRICEQPYFATPGNCFYDYALGGTKDISSVAPTLSTGPINYGGVPGMQGPQGPQGVPGTTTATSSSGGFTAGGPFSSPNNLNTWSRGTAFLDVYGTSQECGFSVSAGTCSLTPYTNVFATAMGWTVRNHAVASSACPDIMASSAFWTTSITTNSINYLGWITNDASVFQPLAYRADYTRGCREAAEAWVGTVDASKVLAAGFTFGGSWSTLPAPTSNQFGKFSTVVGATATVTITGQTLYLVSAKAVGNNSTSSITVDGVPVFDSINQSTTFAEGIDVASALGGTSAPYLLAFRGLGAGPHTIVKTCLTVPDINSYCSVMWAQAMGPDSATAGGPVVITNATMHYATSQQGCTAGTTLCHNDTVVAYYRDQAFKEASEMGGDGLQTALFDISNLGIYDPNSGSCGAQSDGIHLTQCAHNAVGASLASKMTNSEVASVKLQSRIPGCTSAFNGMFCGGPPSVTLGGTSSQASPIPNSLGAANGFYTGNVYLGRDGILSLSRLSQTEWGIATNGGISKIHFGPVGATTPSLCLTGGGVPFITISDGVIGTCVPMPLVAQFVTVSGNPTNNLQLAPKQYVDALNSLFPLVGVTGTITGTALTATCDSGTVTVTGASVGKPVSVSSTTGVDVGAAFNLRASVTATNTVTVYVCGTGTPASLAYNVSVAH